MDHSRRPARSHSNPLAGTLVALGGVLPLIGVGNPALGEVFPAGRLEALAMIADQRTPWLVATWLIAAGTAAGLAGLFAYARALRTTAADAAAVLFLAGSTLVLASLAFDLTVTAAGTRPGAPMPDGYLTLGDWASGLFAAGYAFLNPAALIALALATIRARTLPHWAGVVCVVAALALLGQLIAFADTAPFPQYLALVPLGIAIARPPRRSDARSQAP